MIRARSTVLTALALLAGCGDPGGEQPVLGKSLAELPWASQATLVPSDGGGIGSFLDLHGDVAVLGVPTHQHAGVESGAAYVFRRTASGWQEDKELIPTGALQGHEVGTGVAVYGDRIAVGSRSKPAVHIYEYASGSWQEIVEIPYPDPTAGWFGNATALDGDMLAVGAPLTTQNNQWRGAVYIFVKSGSSWVLEQKIMPPADKPYGGFGADIDLENGTLLVGAPTMAIPQATNAGRAYVYVRDPSTQTWSLQGTLSAGTGSSYGNEVALFGDSALVSLRSGLVPQGITHVYERSAGAWSSGIELVPQGLTGSDAFGYGVAWAGGLAFSSAPAGDDFGEKSGRVHAFSKISGSWSQTETLLASPPTAGESIGGSLAGDGSRLLVGATWQTKVHVFEPSTGSGGGSGSGGSGGSGGSTGGTGGFSTGGSAGTGAAGGSAGATGVGGSGATGSGGSGSGGSGANGTGGDAASAGSAGTTAGAAGVLQDTGSSSEGGCGCRTFPRESTPVGWLGVLVAALALGLRKRAVD